MKYLILVFCVAWNAASFGQEEGKTTITNEDVEYLEELIYNQAIQINQLSLQARALPIIAENQADYSSSILSSLTVALASSVVGAVGVETSSEVPLLLAIGGGISAIVIRVSGIINYAKGSQRAKTITGQEMANPIEKKSISERIKEANDAYSIVREERVNSKYSRFDKVEVELKKGFWIEGLIDEVLEWDEDVYKYRVSYTNDKGKEKSKFFDEQQIRSPQ